MVDIMIDVDEKCTPFQTQTTGIQLLHHHRHQMICVSSTRIIITHELIKLYLNDVRAD